MQLKIPSQDFRQSGSRLWTFNGDLSRGDASRLLLELPDGQTAEIIPRYSVSK